MKEEWDLTNVPQLGGKLPGQDLDPGRIPKLST